MTTRRFKLKDISVHFGFLAPAPVRSQEETAAMHALIEQAMFAAMNTILTIYPEIQQVDLVAKTPDMLVSEEEFRKLCAENGADPEASIADMIRRGRVVEEVLATIYKAQGRTWEEAEQESAVSAGASDQLPPPGTLLN